MTDRQQVQRAQAGDHAAFSALVVAHRRMVYGICYRMTGNADDADDLAHEAFVEAFLKLGALRDTEQFVAWLRTLTLNLCRMWLRGRKAVGEELTEDLPAARPVEPDALVPRLRGGLARLSAPLRVTLVLHYLEGLSCEEVATFLDVPVGTVMSRLHRGRAALKQAMAAMPDEEIPVVPEEEFMKDVDAEIAVLLAIFGEDPAAAERLTTLLAHAPERLAQLVAETTDEETPGRLARLLRRLGAPGIEVVLNVALTDESARERAVRVLCAFLARLHQREPGVKMPDSITTSEAYLLIDGIMRSTANAMNKARLLAELLEADTDHATTVLLRNVLLCYPDAALPWLLARFWQAAETPGYTISTPVLTSLAVMGTRFVAALLEALSSGDSGRQSVALNGLESFANGLHARYRESYRFALRYRGVIPPEHVDAAVVNDAVTRTAALLDDPRVEIRNRAIRVLGLLHRAEYRTVLERLATESVPSTRVHALRTLAEIAAPESVPILCAAAQDGLEQRERVAAIEALGRMSSSETVPMLVGLLDDPDAQVRQVAVVALGDIGGDAAREAVHGAMHAHDKALLRTAAKVLNTSPHFRRQPAPTSEPPRPDRQMKKRLLGEEACPDLFISVYAAIAEMPELRPYKERELTRYIARACWDYATTRRELIMKGLMRREAGVYELTDTGQAVWRVEHFIQEHYLQ